LDDYLGIKKRIVDIVWFLAGGVLGSVVVWLLFRARQEGGNRLQREKLQSLEEDKSRLDSALTTAQQENLERAEEIARLETANTHLTEQLQEQEKTLRAQFENLANRILDEKSKKFTDQNKLQIGELLNPLKDKIQSFEKKVQESNQSSLRWNATLKQQIESLADLNKKINQEAENLTRALKGETKTQGNWGEFILESILEKSGLVKDREYFIQESLTSESGRRYQPDVIIKLPDNKQMIIDAKVSLVAYERYVNAEEEEVRNTQLKVHIQSVRRHIKQLSDKDYQKLEAIEGLDFVLLFIPVEPAFSLAVQHDHELFTEAYDRNIVVVSPTTLIATLRTIANIWKNEYQNQHALEIARQSGNLYDKFVGFSDDLLKVGKAMDTAKDSYEDAMNKLTTGSGNLIRRVENIKKLGAKASKTVDAKLLDRAGAEDADDLKVIEDENNA
jgi:DNA recombination protein RmuC